MNCRISNTATRQLGAVVERCGFFLCSAAARLDLNRVSFSPATPARDAIITRPLGSTNARCAALLATGGNPAACR